VTTMSSASRSSGSHGILRGDDDTDANSTGQSSNNNKHNSKNNHIPVRRTSLISDVSGEFSLGSGRSTTEDSLGAKSRQSTDLPDFAIGTLNHTSIGLQGRKTELELLKRSFHTLLESGDGAPEQERQLILISGYSGTGKTTLANRALRKSTEQLGGLLVRGKFDLNLRNTPYSGIAMACAEICGAILQLQRRKPRLSAKLCRQIKTELGSELALLIQVIPVLAEVLECDDTTGHSTSTTNNSNLSSGESESNQGGPSSAGSKHQFNFAFLRFIRAILRQFVPLVIVLDDLQWADSASLDLLDVLLTDATTNSKLMVVGIYRSNEVDETHIFHRIVEDLELKSKDRYFTMTKIEIGNLDLDAVHKIIQELLSIDKNDARTIEEMNSRTLSLADTCHKKTHGNVFFLLEFLSMLRDHRLLQFDFDKLIWTWDDREIENKTKATENVVDLLKAKMAELSKDAMNILKVAACLGSTFEVRTLNIAWERSTELISKEDNDFLVTNLAKLETEGYIAKSIGSNPTHQSYSWGHDKIQEAALALVPESEQAAFAAKVGKILYTQLDRKDLNSAVFVVVNLLNGGDDTLITDDKARLELAELNYEASRKAISLSAFESAAKYAAKGIHLLPLTAWIDHYTLALNIHTIGAQAEGFIGNTETMERYCKQVLLQEDRPILDKLGVYITWIDSVLNQGRMDEARDLSLEILKKFNVKFPKSSVVVGLAVARNIIHIKATMKSRKFSKISVLNDTTRSELIRVLDRLGTAFYFAKDPRLPLVTFKGLRWTMKYGYCDYSSVVVASTGLILTGILNDLQGGSKYGEQALILMEGCKSQITAARTMFLVYAFAFPWTKPLSSLLKPLLRGYDIGLQSG
jgi:predicted ATPase